MNKKLRLPDEVAGHKRSSASSTVRLGNRIPARCGVAPWLSTAASYVKKGFVVSLIVSNIVQKDIPDEILYRFRPGIEARWR